MPEPVRGEPLPIAPLLPEVVHRVERGNLVLVAEPGAGKTTLVPPALLEARAGDGEIVVLAPRRLAARMAAERVATLLGEPVGERCGYQVRFDAKVSARTRIRFMTEGLFTRRLRDDPTLSGTSVVVFDELHERHLDADLALALCRRRQREDRADLRLVAMSATMDADPVAHFLDAPVMQVPGRAFPVEIEYRRDEQRTLDRQVLRALADEVERGLDGHVLVFLPGAGEIRRCLETCRGFCDAHGLLPHALFGELDRRAQDLAVASPSDPARRKVIFSTNVAETSVTIDGVAVVIDSGLARIAAHDPWTGIGRLDLGPVSRASATQRAGRAGRTRAGRCVRLYGRGDFERRRPYDRPEMARLDLTGLVLDTAAAGRDVQTLDWLETPPPEPLAAAVAVAQALGAIDERRRLTAIGRQMHPLPLPPRLARLVVEGGRLGVGPLAADVAAVLAERPLRRDERQRASSDVAADPLVDLDRLGITRRGRPDRDVDPGLAARIERVRKQLRSLVGQGGGARGPSCTPGPASDAALCRALLTAFADHVAKVVPEPDGELRRDGRRKLALAGGGSAMLSAASHVRSAPWCVALSVETRAGGGASERTIVRSAAGFDPDWLIEDHADRIEELDELRFDAERERVVAVSELRYMGLLIERDEGPARPGPEASELLRRVALARGPAAFCDAAALAQLERRSQFVARHRPEFPRIDEARATQVLAELCDVETSLAALRRAGLLDLLRAQLGAEIGELDRLAPPRITLPGGRKLQVHYEVDRPPWVASRLQDFFGSQAGPAVLDGQVPLVLHLRAPNNRDVQVTTDLAGFWTRHYPELRKALMRRYPKHAWPEDPASASPPSPVRRSNRRRR